MEDWSSWSVAAAFLGSAAVILVAGTRLTSIADRLADITGWGEALVGAVLLGGSTSLAGIVTSVTAASAGHAEMAVSNAIGGIAAQTTFLAMADMAHRQANLEHAAASVENLVQGALLCTLLALPLLGSSGPDVSVLGVHPVSVALVGTWLFGLHLVKRARSEHLWAPETTRVTKLDEPDEARAGDRPGPLALRFAVLGVIVGAAGWLVATSGIAIADRTGLDETVVGGVLTAIATSLPELVTSIAAVRRGALTLAVGGIIGGNAFDVLFVAFSDVAYRSGSIYHAMTDKQVFVIALTILMTGFLLLGLLRRERHGIANIGFESFLVLVLYLGGFALVAVG